MGTTYHGYPLTISPVSSAAPVTRITNGTAPFPPLTVDSYSDRRSSKSSPNDSQIDRTYVSWSKSPAYSGSCENFGTTISPSLSPATRSPSGLSFGHPNRPFWAGTHEIMFVEAT